MPRINLPADAGAKVRRANHELENEHFANGCPNAPEARKANAKKRLG
jgi:hypothetical protein